MRTLILLAFTLLTIPTWAEDNLGPDIRPAKPKVIPKAQEVEEPETPEYHEDGHRYLHFSAYAFFDTSNSVVFTNASATASGSKVSGDANMRTDMAGGAGLELWHAQPHSWGWSGGITYDGRRSVSSATLSYFWAFSPAVYVGSLPSFTLFTIYGNAIYRADKWYFPFGFNATIPTVTQGEGDNGSTHADGGIGTQGGAGYHICEHFSVEALLRLVTFRLTHDDGPDHYDLGTGYFAGAHINAKFDF
jgi:hypothetical protein